MKRPLFLISLLALAVALIAGCAPRPTPAPTKAPPAVAAQPTAEPTAVPAAATAEPPTIAPEPTATPKPLASKEGTLTIWIDAARVPMIESLGAKFEEKYGVPVAVQELGFGDVRDQLKIAGPAGEGPDIIIGAHDWLGELASNGLLEPLDLGDKAKLIDPVAIKAFTYDGKLYGLGYNVEAIALIYNKDLVPEPPKTWDELKAIANSSRMRKRSTRATSCSRATPITPIPSSPALAATSLAATRRGTIIPKIWGSTAPVLRQPRGSSIT